MAFAAPSFAGMRWQQTPFGLEKSALLDLVLDF